jgi:hypothetical protein
MEHH